jgi:hypothetical protein
MYGSKHSQTRESQGWNFTLLHSTEGYPTKTASTKTTRALEEQSSLARRDTTTWLTGTGRSQGYDYLCSTKFLLWKHSHHVYFSNQYLYQIPDSYHRWLLRIDHHKTTPVHYTTNTSSEAHISLPTNHAFNSEVYSTKYIKGYKAACLK